MISRAHVIVIQLFLPQALNLSVIIRDKSGSRSNVQLPGKALYNRRAAISPPQSCNYHLPLTRDIKL
jgi:hypothetical protein